jgi:quercetin dioxygenase-like cupin family protein
LDLGGGSRWHRRGGKEKASMKMRSMVGAACAAVAIAASVAAAVHGLGETVTPHFEHAIPNIPGKSLVALVVDYAPGGASPSHTHAKSAFVFAYVVSGEIESQVNDGPKRVYRAGESFYETPGSSHPVSRNASKTEPAKLLAVFVVDTADKELTTPVE